MPDVPANPGRRFLEPVSITLRDATRAVARIRLSALAGRHPVLAVPEYLPHRCRADRWPLGTVIHAARARQGQAGVQVIEQIARRPSRPPGPEILGAG